MPATEQTWRSQKLMHKVFGASGIILLVSTIWMFAADHNREWKETQRTFRHMEVVMGQWQQLAISAQQNMERHAELQEQIQAEKAARPSQALIDDFKQQVRLDLEYRYRQEGKSEQQAQAAAEQINSRIDQLVAADDDAAAKLWKEQGKRQRDALLAELASLVARARFREDFLLDQRKMKSSEFDAAKSDLDLAIRDEVPTEAAQANVDRVKQELDELTARYQQAAANREKLQQILADITKRERNLQKELDELKAELAQIEKSVQDRGASWFSSQYPFLGKKWLELPILDAFNSPLQIDNLWTDGLTHDMYNFKAVLRYDRCTTCHQAMEKTQKGSSVEPLFPPQHELTFTLATPAQEEAESAQQRELLTLRGIYGFGLATEGMLERDDVTVNFVADNSRAAAAKMVDTPAGQNYLAREIVEQSLSAAWPEDAPTPVWGLIAGDVLMEINGDKILGKEQVRRKLLETITWGKDITVKVRRGFPNPYVTHPRLDLFVGSASPHQLQVMGCTVCHEGQGSATSFKWASHTPDTLKERAQWRQEYGWFNNHHWIFPMFPTRFAESSCLKCHHEVVELEPSERFPEPPAPKLMDGYQTVRRFGCFGCHEINGYDGPDERVGPDLRLEPNYYAAGYQLAHIAGDRKNLFAKRVKQLEADLAKLQGEEKEAVEFQLAALTSHQEVLDQVAKLGLQLGDQSDLTKTRHRLKEIVNHDQDEFDRFLDAVEAGEKTKGTYVPALPTTAYDLALVLQDEETPGNYRKVGPSLRFLGAKFESDPKTLNQPFLDDWIRQPRHFRPSTRMPQFFGLWSHLQGEGDEVVHHTQQLEEVEIAGIRTYLLNYSQPFDLESSAASGDAERGKLMFETQGCLACHSNADFPGHGDQGPNLAGLGDKLDSPEGRRWLYDWIENPQRYSTRTKMPVVHLKPLPGNEKTDPIADVVAYLLASKKQGYKAIPAKVDEKRLDELALTHLEKTFYKSDAEEYVQDGIPESRRSELKGAEVELLMADELVSQGEALSQKQKLLYVGSKAIGKYGCYACHDIPGFENAKPIGTALADWGLKEPSKLAFEHISHFVPHAEGGHAGHGHDGHGHDAMPEQVQQHEDLDPYYLHELHHHSRIGFIWQKLRQPRSYDFAKVVRRDKDGNIIHLKGYNERLRMPQFTFNFQPTQSAKQNAARNAEAREEVITFVLGLVADPPDGQFVYQASPRQQAINEGRKALEKFNCGGCHELDSEKWDFSFPSDWQDLAENPPPEPTTFDFLIPHVTDDERAESEFLSRSGRQSATLVGKVLRGAKGELTARAFDEIDQRYLPLEELNLKQVAPDRLAYEFSLWQPTLISGMQYMPKDKLPPIPVAWVTQRVPHRGGEFASYLVPRTFDADIVGSGNPPKGTEAWGWVPPALVGEGRKVQPEWLHAFLLDPHPIRPAVLLNMPKFNMSSDEATALVNYFAAKDDANYPYEFQERMRTAQVQQLAEAYRREIENLPPEKRDLFTGNRFEDAMRIITNKTGCIQCHSVADYESQNSVRARGPNLAMAHRRLRPQFTREWIAYPWYKLPYTTMPENFTPQDGFKVKDLYHGSGTEQLDAVVDLLMNFDKYAEQNTSIADLVPEPPEIPAPAATGSE